MNHNYSFSLLDIHFARFMERLAGDDQPGLFLAAALLSRCVADGHVCLDLKAFANQDTRLSGSKLGILPPPELTLWQRQLEESPVVGKPEDERPLILDEKSRLYLYRYWEYENILADKIGRLAHDRTENVDPERLREIIERLFPAAPGREPDWQKFAALLSCFKRLTVISGSPGTGKTSTVAKILALLIELDQTGHLKVALTAPTGKAAAKLEESIGRMKETLDCSDDVKARIPEKATTLHRLLGSLPMSPYFLHNAGNPLPHRLIVVDEASMVDLPLLSKLVQAMPPASRLILLGDKHQLASIEAGAVLGDICGNADMNLFSPQVIDHCGPYVGREIMDNVRIAESAGLHDCVVELRTNYRFADNSDIGRFSAAINRGEGPPIMDDLKRGQYRDVRWSALPRARDLARHLKAHVMEGFRDYLNLVYAHGHLEELFDAFAQFRFLCALRQGPFGVTTLNDVIEHIIGEEGLIRRQGPFYHGQPVMILRNSSQLKLFNGDVGLILSSDRKDGELTAVFREGSGRFSHLSPQRLPEHETVYAMTVHKSQGSEFEKILLLLSDKDVPVLTRELIYTGVTRARKQVVLWCDEAVFNNSVSRRIQRSSGLQEGLWLRNSQSSLDNSSPIH